MTKHLHQNLASGRWFQLSLVEQLANIGSEVGRARKWRGKDKDIFWSAVERALELFSLTIRDNRWGAYRLREVSRAHELFCDAVLGGENYNTSLKDLEDYFLPFALLARRKM